MVCLLLLSIGYGVSKLVYRSSVYLISIGKVDLTMLIFRPLKVLLFYLLRVILVAVYVIKLIIIATKIANI